MRAKPERASRRDGASDGSKTYQYGRGRPGRASGFARLVAMARRYRPARGRAQGPLADRRGGGGGEETRKRACRAVSVTWSAFDPRGGEPVCRPRLDRGFARRSLRRTALALSERGSPSAAVGRGQGRSGAGDRPSRGRSVAAIADPQAQRARQRALHYGGAIDRAPSEDGHPEP